jgi:hypothetical protein
LTTRTLTQTDTTPGVTGICGTRGLRTRRQLGAGWRAAAAELGALRPLLASAFGEESTQVHNLDKQVRRVRTPSQ